jgi:hypothetical protein
MCYAVLNPQAEPLDLTVKEEKVVVEGEQGEDNANRQMRSEGENEYGDFLKVREYSEEEYQQDFGVEIETRNL